MLVINKGVHRDLMQLLRNARHNFFRTHVRRCRVVSIVKVKKGQCQDILIFHVDV